MVVHWWHQGAGVPRIGRPAFLYTASTTAMLHAASSAVVLNGACFRTASTNAVVATQDTTQDAACVSHPSSRARFDNGRRTFQLPVVGVGAVAVHALDPLRPVGRRHSDAVVDRRHDPVGHCDRALRTLDLLSGGTKQANGRSRKGASPPHVGVGVGARRRGAGP